MNRVLQENFGDIVGSLRSAAQVEPALAEAADIVSLLTASECYSRLVVGCGWTIDRAEAWIAKALALMLLKEATPSQGSDLTQVR